MAFLWNNAGATPTGVTGYLEQVITSVYRVCALVLTGQDVRVDQQQQNEARPDSAGVMCVIVLLAGVLLVGGTKRSFL